MPANSLDLRRRPVQARSSETFEQILVSAADLLEEVGWDGFNTNLLAQRAGVGVRAVYRYFPNKLAVVSTLARRLAEEWDEWFVRFEPAIENEQDLLDAWPQMIDIFLDGLRKQPGGLAVRCAMGATPVLREIDREDNDRLASVLAAELSGLRPERSPAEARAAARLLIETAVAAIDHSLAERPAAARRIVTELKRMHAAYLESWLASR